MNSVGECEMHYFVYFLFLLFLFVCLVLVKECL